MSSWPQGDTPFDPGPALAKARELERAPKQDDPAVASQAGSVLRTLAEYVDSLPQAQRHEVSLRLLAEIRRKIGP